MALPIEADFEPMSSKNFRHRKRRRVQQPNGASHYELLPIPPLHPWRLNFCNSWAMRVSQMMLNNLSAELKQQRSIGSVRDGLKIPCPTGLLNAQGNRITRTLPSVSQIRTLFNYIDLEGNPSTLMVCLLNIALPDIIGAFHFHHYYVFGLMDLLSSCQRVKHQEQDIDETLIGAERAYIPPELHPPFSDMPWHYVCAVIRFGQAQVCGAGPEIYDEILRQLIDDKKFQTSRAWDRRLGFHNMKLDTKDTDFEAATPPVPRNCRPVSQRPWMPLPHQSCAAIGCISRYNKLLANISDDWAMEDFHKDFKILNEFSIRIEDRSQFNQNICLICHDAFRTHDLVMDMSGRQIPHSCTHTFHFHCYKHWLWNSKGRVFRCPVCRRMVAGDQGVRLNFTQSYGERYDTWKKNHYRGILIGRPLKRRVDDPDA